MSEYIKSSSVLYTVESSRMTLKDKNLVYNFVNQAKAIEKELNEMKKKLPGLIKLAINMGYGVEHTDDVQKQEQDIVDEIMRKLSE